MADLVFILDSSGSVGRENFGKMLRFATSIVDDLNIGKNATHVAVVTFSSRAWMIFPLDRYFIPIYCFGTWIGF